MSNTLFYFDLESVENRYTSQLSNDWMPWSFEKTIPKDWAWHRVTGQHNSTPTQINVGQVLDATGRSIYAMEQCIEFLELIRQGKVKNGDVLYFQDFWTPGIEAIFYALDMYKIITRNYSMLHAQSTDEYDFTYQMRDWMRHFELGIEKKMNGIFLGSQVHKDLLRSAGFNAPIYILSLPFGKTIELKRKDRSSIMDNKKNQVVFTSRFDFEKNPMFMLEVAEKFLALKKDWVWIITTGTEKVRSNDQFIIDKIHELENKNIGFKVIRNISKEQYYDTLAESKIQFNSSLQDFVSWTLLEATTFQCIPVYPNFRSFPEILPKLNLYDAFKQEEAISKLIQFSNCNENYEYDYIPEISELGLLIESYIMFNNWDQHEINIWLEKEYCKEKFNFLKENKCDMI
jgi:glycosyltransferase involved in cell wall biosynthesis